MESKNGQSKGKEIALPPIKSKVSTRKIAEYQLMGDSPIKGMN